MNSQTPMIGLLRLLGLGDSGLHSPADLARRLGLSEALAAAMTEDLIRRGYLAEVGSECAAQCASCGLKPACRPADSSAARLLALTPKGRRAAQM